jgi:hypothetical protein
MKNLSLLLFLSFILFAACNNDADNIDGNSTINNSDLVGNWKLNEDIQSYRNDTLQFSSNIDYSLEMKDDGSMLRTSINTVTTLYWVKNNDGTAIFIIEERQTQNGDIFTSSRRMTIEEDEIDKQVWKQETVSTGVIDVGTGATFDYKSITTWTLERE